jgi:hypothetical protein
MWRQTSSPTHYLIATKVYPQSRQINDIKNIKNTQIRYFFSSVKTINSAWYPYVIRDIS